MYELEFLPLAKDDLCEIAYYISHELSNPAAATKLSEELIDAAESLRRFPHSGQAYFPIRPLHRSYRRILVKNYLMFYYVSEPYKVVTIARVLYACRSAITQLLKEDLLEGMQTPIGKCLSEDEVQW